MRTIGWGRACQGGAEEDEDQCQEVQGGVDKTLHRQEDEERVAALVAEANAGSRGREAGLGVVDTMTTRDRTTTRQMLPRDVLEGRV